MRLTATPLFPMKFLDSRQSHPVVGVVALDAMAAIAGDARAPGFEQAWSDAFEIVTAAMLPENADPDLAIAA